MQTLFRSSIGFHKWYLGETGGFGHFFMLAFSFTFDLIVSLAKEMWNKSRKVESMFQ